MSVFTLGLNHTTAPVDMRGRFAFSPEQLSPALRGFRERLLRAVPEAGKANAALARLVAAACGVAATQVSLSSGATARIKSLQIEGDSAALAAALARTLGA